MKDVTSINWKQTSCALGLDNSLQTDPPSTAFHLWLHQHFHIQNPHEKFNVLSHLISGFLALLGLIALLIEATPGEGYFLTIWIYGFSLIFVFFASGLWHMHKRNEEDFSRWTLVDEIAIYVVIAGAFTPIAVFYLEGLLRKLTIGFQWGSALMGILFKIKFAVIKRWKTAIIYLIMGWSALIPVQYAFSQMSSSTIMLLFGCGIFTSIGAILFATKKPKHFHEIFHVLVTVALAFHYITVFSFIAN
ncbi:MAG: hemolysin III family protein [Candidatus Lokiarchaeota archaeon]|nr:hemolysin III family protein [Candidatus Harpocratesius repetitus]